VCQNIVILIILLSFIHCGGGSVVSESTTLPTETGSVEICDQLDNDLDGEVDENNSQGSQTFYQDADGDGSGNPSVSVNACSQPTGYVTNNLDACDTDATTILCSIYYADHDGDGCGSLQDTSCLCAATDIYVSKGGDVDDDDSSVFLGGIEFIDELDQDCDGEIRSIELASAYSIFEGGSIGDDNGFNLESVDFNGDGVDDLLIGSPYAENHKGHVYLVYGSPALNLQIQDVTFVGETSGDEIGRYIANGGDTNNDGCEDILIGSPYQLSGKGKTYLIYGTGTGCIINTELDGSFNVVNLDQDGQDLKGVTFLGVNISDYSGANISPAGDLDGDGLNDFLIGAYGASATASFSGMVYVIYARALNDPTCFFQANPKQINLSVYDTQLDPLCGFEIYGEGSGSVFGITLASLNDVNGNGSADVLIGAYGYNPTGSPETIYQGQVYLFDFDQLTLGAIVDTSDAMAYYGGPVQIYQTGDIRACGQMLAGLGDVDGDSNDDFMVGCYAFDNPNVPMIDTGMGALYYGGTNYSGDIAYDTNALVFNGAEFHGHITEGEIAGHANFNGDAYGDFVIGANRADGKSFENGGKTYLVLGRARADFTSKVENGYYMLEDVSLSFNEDAGFIFLPERAFDESGFGVTTGDFDGDGDSDVAIGAPGDEINKNYHTYGINNPSDPARRGKVYLFLSDY